MNTKYTNEVNTQIVLSLLKAHGIRKVIASPGTTNIRLVASMQQDPFFEMYSAADERSAAYMACGMAEESGEAVVLSCTGATASRNYVPGLTEAFYRKLPVLAITSTQHTGRIGQNIAQVLDRSQQMRDMVKLSVSLPTCHVEEDEWACNVRANQAMLELFRNGGGPVHIDLETTYSNDFSVHKLPVARVIKRYTNTDKFPSLIGKKVGIFVGAHSNWSAELTAQVNHFCDKYDAIVLCDQTSNYRGPYRVLLPLICCQNGYLCDETYLDVLIDIGNISGAYVRLNAGEVWRVNPDGEIRDTYKKLTCIFQVEEVEFFAQMNRKSDDSAGHNSIEIWKMHYEDVYNKIEDLPFSNIWMAKQVAPMVPDGAVLHLGILNTLRSWNFFETPETVSVYCNTGGFGIDGILSAAIGAALASPNKLVYCIIGDLAFFYDMNALGNRYLPNNIRIMLINNGVGTEFKNYNHPGAQFGEDANAYIAAAGHYGAKSPDLIKHYAEDLGFSYMTASSKAEFMDVEKVFFTSGEAEHPYLLEVFTNSKDESAALQTINELSNTAEQVRKAKLKSAVKEVVGEQGVKTLKKLFGK